MDRIVLLLTFCILGLGCSISQPDEKNGTVPDTLIGISGTDHPLDFAAFGIQIRPDSLISYSQMKQQAETLRQSLKAGREAGTISADSVGRAFTRLMVNGLIPYWYGTPWDFNGYTNQPQKGVIACGYYVSTTLTHAGLRLNRYALAQQAGLNEAKSLACGTEIFQWHATDVRSTTERMMAEFENGLWFVGLDFHVGFLLKQAGELFFLHSSYLDPVAVVIEKALDSEALSQSATFVIAAVSTNEKLMKKWLDGSEIQIFK
jgi:hypothetical protein